MIPDREKNSSWPSEKKERNSKQSGGGGRVSLLTTSGRRRGEKGKIRFILNLKRAFLSSVEKEGLGIQNGRKGYIHTRGEGRDGVNIWGY